MNAVIDDTLLCCGICTSIIANDDATSLDYYYDSAKAERMERDIRASIHEIQSSVPGGYLVVGDCMQGFSWSDCEICGIGIGESGYTVTLLGETS
jgi:hypothetical protein